MPALFGSLLARFSNSVNSNICITRFDCTRSNISFNSILRLMKIKTNFRSLSVKELLNSATRYLLYLFLFASLYKLETNKNHLFNKCSIQDCLFISVARTPFINSDLHISSIRIYFIKLLML